ncbi:hypothetical protein NECAME_06955 [Necator americanus]|uniref:Uncharacterized protein n=1 Tax=Necator americanus TaxID=51031 RepID=W2TT99_NECAM|nr:hypothetical protein NECAME_06955 [Necator americanus]ETN84267.1 hypothetical protein NECAME_06955 [Necator americanus]
MQMTSGITGAVAIPSCAGPVGGGVVSAPLCCSYDEATPSPIHVPHSAMAKQQRQSAASATADNVRLAAADHILEYSACSSSTLSTPDALRVAYEQLRKIYIAEASLLKSMEMCSSSSDFDYLVEALRQLRNFETDVQRRLFSHIYLFLTILTRICYSCDCYNRDVPRLEFACRTTRVSFTSAAFRVSRSSVGITLQSLAPRFAAADCPKECLYVSGS